jgi:hypothetical protein
MYHLTCPFLRQIWEVNADEAKLYTTLYIALIYGVFYSFFVSFPLVYPVIYDFNLGESSLPFLTVSTGIGIGIPIYFVYWGYFVTPRVNRDGFGPPENLLWLALFFSWLIPVGLFLFGESRVSSSFGLNTRPFTPNHTLILVQNTWHEKFKTLT